IPAWSIVPHRLPHASQMPGGPKCHGASAGLLRWPMHRTMHIQVAADANALPGFSRHTCKNDSQNPISFVKT
ncbi:hypothetical protein, partial [Xanthomonas perforans]|uniref:hypothetical protein n=1 Tax=Xanthomonas perforans TaxID=442694 RepID=UPI0019D0EB11